MSNSYEQDLDKNEANFASLTQLCFCARHEEWAGLLLTGEADLNRRRDRMGGLHECSA